MSDFFEKLDKKGDEHLQKMEIMRKSYCEEFAAYIDKKVSEMYDEGLIFNQVYDAPPSLLINNRGFKYNPKVCSNELSDVLGKKYNARSGITGFYGDRPSVRLDIEIYTKYKHISVNQ